MCLWVLAQGVHPRYPFVFAGNRDEFHRRPANAADWWPGEPILAGRDLQAGGTWLGLSASGRFAVVTNFHEADGAAGNRPSRGALVPFWLTGGLDAAEQLQRLRDRGRDYAGFNLVFGDGSAMHYISNRNHETSPLPPGIHGLANGPLDSDWPKVMRLREGFAAALDSERVDPDAFFELLADTRPAAGSAGASGGMDAELGQRLSAPFVLHPEYGTRCSTVIHIDSRRTASFVERRFDPLGNCTGESSFRFEIGPRDGR